MDLPDFQSLMLPLNFDLGVVRHAQHVTKRVDTGWFGDEPGS